MYTCDDPRADLDDLSFEKGADGPSNRKSNGRNNRKIHMERSVCILC